VNIVTGPLLFGLFVVSAGLFLYLLVRPPTRLWLRTSVSALLVGGTLAVATWLVLARLLHVIRIPLSHVVYFWLAATLAGVGVAVVNLWRSRWWRKLTAAMAILVFLVTGTLAINATFGLNRTIGALVGASQLDPIVLTPPTGGPKLDKTSRPFWKIWKPPPGMPLHGQVGTAMIPGTLSGFAARPAGIYLPPAALATNPPSLPLVVMMMGQPGNPDPSFAAIILDRFAAKNHGLAPIVVVADQLGNPNVDTLCLNTAEFGNIETYITQDVVNWATTNLPIIHDHRYWTIAGYSNGGQCAMSFIAKHPGLWSNILDISGEEYPGSDSPTGVLNGNFGGDQAAYDAQKPINILAKIKLPGTFGVFTVGSNDGGYIPGIQRTVAAAAAAGMSVVYYEAPNGGHVLPALTDGLQKGFDLLYPRLGLSAGPP
jgi:poly(3-hydroxybutyrate) depolymerase